MSLMLKWLWIVSGHWQNSFIKSFCYKATYLSRLHLEAITCLFMQPIPLIVRPPAFLVIIIPRILKWIEDRFSFESALPQQSSRSHVTR